MSKLEFSVDNSEIRRFFTNLSRYLVQATVTSASGQPLDMAEAVNQIMALAHRTHAADNKPIFVGNGGSFAIASHMATDCSKNGDVRAMALNDTSMLTCPGNDLGYDPIFAKRIELYARPDDLVIAIRSSGPARGAWRRQPVETLSLRRRSRRRRPHSLGQVLGDTCGLSRGRDRDHVGARDCRDRGGRGGSLGHAHRLRRRRSRLAR
jgi:hypothetical protein